MSCTEGFTDTHSSCFCKQPQGKLSTQLANHLNTQLCSDVSTFWCTSLFVHSCAGRIFWPANNTTQNTISLQSGHGLHPCVYWPLLWPLVWGWRSRTRLLAFHSYQPVALLSVLDFINVLLPRRSQSRRSVINKYLHLQNSCMLVLSCQAADLVLPAYAWTDITSPSLRFGLSCRVSHWMQMFHARPDVLQLSSTIYKSPFWSCNRWLHRLTQYSLLWHVELFSIWWKHPCVSTWMDLCANCPIRALEEAPASSIQVTAGPWESCGTSLYMHQRRSLS